MQIRGDMLRRGLLLNEYLITSCDNNKTSLKREYEENNTGNFNYFIVNNFRKELNFSYLSWKIIEEIANKNLSILDFKTEFV